jgi:hypothetical protein
MLAMLMMLMMLLLMVIMMMLALMLLMMMMFMMMLVLLLLMMMLMMTMLSCSLGHHKVRSLTLDEWPTSVRLLMEAVGNDRSNAIWEAALSGAGAGAGSMAIKPGADCDRAEREAWIKDKYQLHKFVQAPPPPPSSKAGAAEAEKELALPRRLYEAARVGDVTGILQLIALGVDLDAALPEQGGRTAVHVACARGQLVCLELLLANGASMYALDAGDCAPLDYAMGNGGSLALGDRGDGSGEGSEDCMALLVSKLEDGGEKKQGEV